jgi:hypothetical protein
MAGLWKQILPVIQEINNYGGNFVSIFICRSVIDEIDRRSDGGDATLIEKRGRLLDAVRRGKWPQDPNAFSSVFETYHEALFYLLADTRGVALRSVPEVKTPTPDFVSIQQPTECFEIKTIDLSEGELAHTSIAHSSLDQRIAALEQAKRRGIGTGLQIVNPHGDATNTKEAVERVMRQIGGNVKSTQFSSSTTFLVVPLIRTAIRSDELELERRRSDPHLGGIVSGHLWTIAAQVAGESFMDATLDAPAHDLGALDRAGILRDFAFICGMIFLNTEWNLLGSADVSDPTVLGRAYRLFGVWNDRYQSSQGGAVTPSPQTSAFSRLCHAWCHSDT